MKMHVKKAGETLVIWVSPAYISVLKIRQLRILEIFGIVFIERVFVLGDFGALEL